MSRIPIGGVITSIQSTEATITIGDVPIHDTFARISHRGTDTMIFSDYKVANRYEKDGHTYMLPIASPGGFRGASAAFVQLAQPTLLWIADWTAARWEVPPEIPSPVPINPNWILLDEHLEPYMMTLGANGLSVLYRISGTYVFGHRNPNNVAVNDIMYPQPPWMENGPNRRQSPILSRQGIIDGIIFGGPSPGSA